jgi:NAD+ kinase
MPKVVIIHKAQTEAAKTKAHGLADWLDARGLRSQVVESGLPHLADGPDNLPRLASPARLVVVLGGDGTMLGAVRSVAAAGLWQTPILGVNLGGLGYLTALAPDELFPAMEKVLAGKFQAPARMMLQARVERDGREIRRITALNDVVVNKAARASIIDIETTVDGRPLTNLRADGLIVATPTGSTAYNLSAGGPICHPGLDCMVVTPICSFALSNRPLLLSPDMVLGVRLGRRAQYTALTCDGQVGFELRPEDHLIIRRAEDTVRIISSPFRDYFKILRTKLRWG